MKIQQPTVKLGDTVSWRGRFGTQPAAPARVEAMEITTAPRCKDGTPASEVSWQLVRENRVIFDLDNGYWAYSEQIEPLPGWQVEGNYTPADGLSHDD